jgi:hypothetical protein
MNKYIQDMLDRQAYIDQNMQRKDPFDKGIMRAVSSAKQSLGMDEEQSDRALRNSLLSFSDALYQDQTPMGKGFMGKFAALGRAMNPALRTHDQYEDLAQNENMQLAKEAQNFRAMEEAKMAKMEHDAYMREMNDQKMALEQEKLNEIRDYHNQSLLAKLAGGKNQKAQEKKDSLEELKGMLTHAENKVKNLGSEGERGIFKRMINKSWLPTGGDLPLTKEQAEIQTIGDVLKGKLFNAWGYRNQAEFNHVPSVSPDNDMATNLRIIGDLKQMLLNVGDQVNTEQTINNDFSDL